MKNFRCFSELKITLDHPIIIIKGDNGSGKTTLLEALHYLCYLRSFRTYNPKELIQLNKPHFFVKAHYKAAGELHEIQAGCIGSKRLVKIDNKPVSSFKELMDYYRVITLTEDDVSFIKGGPHLRRSFIDQALVLIDHKYIETVRAFKSILDNRNTLLKAHKPDKVAYDIWTNQLESSSAALRSKRKKLLGDLSREVNGLIDKYFKYDTPITIAYKSKELTEDLKSQEYRLGRSLFGAHLDDFSIYFKEKQSRFFASRGQQKLIIVLLKVAQAQLLSAIKGDCLFIADDFLTDFDELRLESLVAAIGSLRGQQIFTSPLQHLRLTHFLSPFSPLHVDLPNRN